MGKTFRNEKGDTRGRNNAQTLRKAAGKADKARRTAPDADAFLTV